MKEGDEVMAKCFFKKVRKQGMSLQLPAIRMKVMSRCLSAPDATSLHHCLHNHRQYFTILSGKDPANRVFNIMHS